jgi:hypothetical protein
MILELVMFAIGIYGLLGITTLQIGLEPVFIDDNYWFMLTGFIFGLFTLLAWCAFAIFLIGKSTRKGLLYGEIVFGAIMSGFSGLQIANDANELLDRSAPTYTDAYIEEKYTVTTGSGRDRKTRTYLKLKFAENPKNVPAKLKLNSLKDSYYKAGGGVRLKLREGFLGAGYVEQMTPIPAPFKPLLTNNIENSAIDSRLRELAYWKPEIPVPYNRNTRINWVEEKYASGQLRSREPHADGLKHGEASYWHQNGKLYGNIIWVSGGKHGIVSLYRPDGSIEQSLSYKNGKLHGLSRWYYEDGRVSNYAIYEDGSLLNAGTDLSWLDA